MSKINSEIEDKVMTRIKTEEVTMKPRWYFVVGSVFMLLGLVSLTVGSIFLSNLTLFLLKQHGPMGQWRLETLLDSFSWWIPALAILGMTIGIMMLRQYDFSYRKNLTLVVLGFLASIIISALLIDHFGLNNLWSQLGPMKKFYQQLENKNTTPGRMQNGSGRFRNRP